MEVIDTPQGERIRLQFVMLNIGRASFIIHEARRTPWSSKNRASSVKRGCAEKTIVNGFTEIIGRI